MSGGPRWDREVGPTGSPQPPAWLVWPQYPWCVLGPRGSVISQGNDVVLDALVLQLLDVFRHCLFCAKQALGLGHSSIGHRCQGRGKDGEPEAPEAGPGSPWFSGCPSPPYL